MTTHTHRDFFDAFLRAIDLPVRPASRRALACVSIFESSEGNEKWNNPLAVIQPWPNATPYNTFGDGLHVWRYATFTDGVNATATLYAEPHWAGVRWALSHYTTREPILNAFTKAYTWASFDFALAPFNTTGQLLARLDHRLYGPND